MDKIILLKYGHATTSPHLVQELSRAVDGAIATQIAVYGSDEIVPKCHRMHHLYEQITESKCVVGTFMIENLDLITRYVMSHVHNPTTFEASLLAGVCERQRSSLNSGSIFQGLLGQTAPLLGFMGTLAASKMNCFGMHISVGDVVFRGEAFGVVTACVEDASGVYAIVTVWQKVRQVAPHAFRCARCDMRQAWPGSEIQ